MPALDAKLNAVDATLLTPLVRKALGSRGARVVDWSYSTMSEGRINPVTAGLVLFRGTARDGTRQVPWSLVLKAIHWVDLSGTPLGQHYMDEPSDWNYWKREALVFRSGILEEWQGELVPVRCYDVVDQADGSIWLWLEHVEEAADAAWRLDRHVLAALHTGEFNGAWTARPIPDYPWLCRGFMRQWVRTFHALGSVETFEDQAIWEHPRVRRVFPEPVAGRTLRLVEDSERLLDRLEAQPTTLSHLDVQRSNFFTRRGARGQDQTVVIDWSFLGETAVGEDLGMQVSANLTFLVVAPAKARRYYERALQAYLEGLRRAGWRGNPEAVRFACATAASVRYVLFGARSLTHLAQAAEGESWADDLARRRGQPVEETWRDWAEGFRFLLDLGDEARGLLDRI